jgi:hypothetical protein
VHLNLSFSTRPFCRESHQSINFKSSRSHQSINSNQRGIRPLFVEASKVHCDYLSFLISTMANRDSPADAALRSTYSRLGFAEPDLIVVVGGETFLHYSVLLCLASEYFNNMLSSDTREHHTRKIEFPEGDPEEWVRFCRYLEPRSLFTAHTFPVNEEDAKALFHWFHLFGMTDLLQECDERLSISSPKFLDYNLNDVDLQRSTMTEILVWAETATTYGLSETLDATMKELKKAVNAFPEMMTTEILESMSPFWSTTAGSGLWEAIKVILPDDVKSSHNDATLKGNKLLFEIVAQSCKVPAQIRTLKNEEEFNAIVNLMTQYRYCPRIQQEGCAAFRDPILRNDDNHISSAVKDAGIEVIVSAMIAHSNESQVQEQGCRALGNLACNNDANCVSIAAKHGIEAIVSAMRTHANAPKVQERGCLALGNISCNKDANGVLMASKHGVEAIMISMATYTKVSKVQEWGCYTLGNLANNYANRVSIAAKHGIEAIVSAITAHTNVSKVQKFGCYALGNISYFNDANRISIAAKHGIEAIVIAMRTHSTIPDVQEWGCVALGNVAQNSDANCVSIAAKYGIEAIVSAMTVHSNVSRVQEQGCFALGNLACNDVNRVSIAAKLGIEAIVSAMTTHRNVSKVQERGCLALANLAWDKDANRVSIAAKHGIEAIFSAMRAHSNAQKVQEWGRLTLRNLSFNESVSVRIQLVRGLAVLEHNPSNSRAETI